LLLGEACACWADQRQGRLWPCERFSRPSATVGRALEAAASLPSKGGPPAFFTNDDQRAAGTAARASGEFTGAVGAAGLSWTWLNWALSRAGSDA